MSKLSIEICSYSVEWALAAQRAGADRVELCAGPEVGGTTPSHGAIAMARRGLKIALHVIIRPRGGDFAYSGTEFAQMKEDIIAAKSLGVDGVVIGILLPDGSVDKAHVRELVELARPMSVTFHRAFDMARDPQQSLEDVIDTGCTRLLTSGQAATAPLGASCIAKLVKKAGDRIHIMPGAGVRANNLEELFRTTGALEYHSSARKTMTGKMEHRKPALSMGGGNSANEYDLLVADENEIAAMCSLARKLSGTQ